MEIIKRMMVTENKLKELKKKVDTVKEEIEAINETIKEKP